MKWDKTSMPQNGEKCKGKRGKQAHRTPRKNHVIANRCAGRCGNPYSPHMGLCRKGNTDSHVASLLGMTFYENAVSIGRSRAPPLRIYSRIPRKKEVAGRPPLINFPLRSFYSSSCPTRAICSSSSCFCTPRKMAGHFAGSPRINFNPRRK